MTVANIDHQTTKFNSPCYQVFCPYSNVHTIHLILAAATRPTKKLKKEKQSKVGKAMEKTLNVFMKSQTDAKEKFQMREDERKK